MDPQREITDLKNRVAALEHQLQRVLEELHLAPEGSGPTTIGGSPDVTLG